MPSTILAVSGSLRRDSVNTAALRAAAAAARSGLVVRLDDSPRALPQFDPDLEPSPPEAARRFRQACAEADALLFAVPEYAFGMPGGSRTRSTGRSAPARWTTSRWRCSTWRRPAAAPMSGTRSRTS